MQKATTLKMGFPCFLTIASQMRFHEWYGTGSFYKGDCPNYPYMGITFKTTNLF
jgi:hypothetical protein